MDRRNKLAREDGYRNRRENPSFSSTLLDAIYRSIDEPSGETATMKKHGRYTSLKDEEEMKRACMIEKWMQKKGSCDIRRKSMGDCERNYLNDFDDPMLLNSTSSSSGSSCCARFSSSESDKYFCPTAKSRSWSSSSSSHCTTHRPKPARTSVENGFHGHAAAAATQQNPKHEGGFVRTKYKALKIYSNLKKVKHPISPGGRLASFLNSLFTAGNAKKANISSSGYEERKLKPDQQATSTCSSASSFSRSCLSKSTPCSRGNGTKRSVRFCLDEDHHQSRTSIRKPTNKELEWRIMEENRRVVEAAKDLLKNYQKKIVENSDEEDEDAASYASSDLFELDNLSAIGIERYRQELPVYETTHLDTNRAIANGLIV
ncbi:BIG GRAIN 4 [Hibiscus trionum]|uniref:BIG GRAIN 4 n=1 Tax=Hibiscus trionum TaxID=183268 RepID=A0A9W7H9L8_HIBTR|nr:BIG GRAIN 4 [Hibiscus trionum]